MCPSQPQQPQSQVHVARGTFRPARDSREKKPRTCSSPRAFPFAQAHVPRLPGRCEEAPRRRPEDLGEDTLSALEGASSFFGIQTVHLIRALGEQRGRPPASLTLMEVAVKEKLLGALAEQPAVVGMRRQRPLAVPVGNHPERETTPEKGCEVPDHHPSLTGVGRSGVVNTDEEAPHGFAPRIPSRASLRPLLRSRARRARSLRIPPYRRSRAAKA